MRFIRDPVHNRAVLIFGLGLIGRGIARNLTGATAEVDEFGWNWLARNNSSTAEALEQDLHQLLNARGATQSVVEILWSAGKGGFDMNEDDAEAEFSSFEEVVSLAENVARDYSSTCVNFSMISSAGGLFEGQHLVAPDSVPCPRRPYGALKLRQEKRLKASSGLQARRVFRLSTVIGPAAPRVRHGLVSTVLSNSLAGRVTRIYGFPDTLRDYIWVEDVAALIAHRLDPDCGGGMPPYSECHLVSARPVSLQYLLTLVERRIRRRVLKHFVYVTNARNTTFSPAVRPGDLQVTPVEEVVSRLHLGLTGYV